MDKLILILIRELQNKYGNEIFEDPKGKRLWALLADSAEGKYRSEINCLSMAFKEGVYRDLRAKKTLTHADMQKYIVKFEKLHFWGKGATMFAVNTWAEFLDIRPLHVSAEREQKETRYASLKHTSRESAEHSPYKQTTEWPIEDARTYLAGFKPNSINKRRTLTKEACIENSRTWLNRVEVEYGKEQKQICYQIAILEMADLVHISDLSKTSIIEYRSAYKIMKDIYKTATNGLSKTEIIKFQSELNSSGLKHYIPPRYRNSVSRKYSCMLMVPSFLFSLLTSTYGVVYMAEIPHYVANQIMLIPYILSATCMAYLLWSANPNIVTGLAFKINMVFSVVVMGIFVLISMFVQHQMMHLCLALYQWMR